MKVGRLFFDNSDKPFSQKVLECADKFEVRAGHRPNTCEVNELTTGAANVDKAGDIVIKRKLGIIVNHFWIGNEDEE